MVLSGRGQAIADRIFAKRLAECVAKRPALSHPHVDTNRNVQGNNVGAKALGWQNRNSQRLFDLFLGAGKVHKTSANRQVRPQPAVPIAKINDKISDQTLL